MRAIATIAFLGLAACSEQSFFVPAERNPAGPADGSVTGRVCDPTGRTWLADALVYTHIVDDAGHLQDTLEAYTDRDGYWFIDGLPGENEYTFYVQYGGELLESHTVWVGDGEDVRLEEPDCFDPLQLDVAVITGDYDDFQRILDNMGFANYEVVDGLVDTDVTDFLLDLEAMQQYDMIFFNGGFVEEGVIYGESDGGGDTGASVPDQVMENIREYVRGGGTIYASDWAYDVVEIGWPDRIDFVGDDTEPDAAQLGEYDQVEAVVSDAALAEWLGTNYLDIEYDLPVWPPIESVAGSVTTHLRGNVHYRIGTAEYSLASVPLLVSFTSGEGMVAFSTFRVARNATSEMMLVMQYMMYRL